LITIIIFFFFFFFNNLFIHLYIYIFACCGRFDYNVTFAQNLLHCKVDLSFPISTSERQVSEKRGGGLLSVIWQHA